MLNAVQNGDSKSLNNKSIFGETIKKTAQFAAKHALRTLLLTSALAGVALGSSAAMA